MQNTYNFLVMILKIIKYVGPCIYLPWQYQYVHRGTYANTLQKNNSTL